MGVELAVIFDLDGLLADSEPLWTESARVLLDRRGLCYAAELKARTIGRHPLEVMGIYKELYGLPDDPAGLMAERLTILRGLYEQSLHPMPGAPELCSALAAEAVPTAVASSSPSDLVEWVLGRLELRDLITTSVGSDRVERGKPAPDLFLLAAEQLGVAAAVAVVLEDSPPGLLAARAAGMRCVAVPGPDAPAELPPCDLIVHSLHELSPARLRELVGRPRVLTDKEAS